MNILFVCLSNMSYSPLAEGILKKLYNDEKLSFDISSAGLEPYHINYPPESTIVNVAKAHNIDISNHHVQLFQKEDFDCYDKIYVMDTRTFREVKDLCRNIQDLNKVDYLLNLIKPTSNQSLSDPLNYGHESIEDIFKKIEKACQVILEKAKRRIKHRGDIYNLTMKDLNETAARIAPYINRTPIMTSELINKEMGCKILFKCENFQKVGAFKSRGAVNAVFSLPEKELSRGVATHSSGNHAQALARAAQLRGVNAYIVMPESSPKAKVNAVKDYGGKITFCENTLEAREKTLFYTLRDRNAIEIHPYNDRRIICGQATVAKELIEETGSLDFILAPVGGGGLLSGTALATQLLSPRTSVIGCEPENANDAFLSFEKKELIPQTNPNTIADGLRTSLGDLTFSIIIGNVDKIMTVKEENIISAMRLIWERMKIVIEPSSAVPLAVVLENKAFFKDQTIGIILSGGNLDLDKLPWN